MIACATVQVAVGRVSEAQAAALKPSFHITGSTGWINDPNGMFQGKTGMYHVFFQVPQSNASAVLEH